MEAGVDKFHISVVVEDRNRVRLVRRGQTLIQER
jgi:hypothetical protein